MILTSVVAVEMSVNVTNVLFRTVPTMQRVFIPQRRMTENLLRKPLAIMEVVVASAGVVMFLTSPLSADKNLKF